MCIVLYTLLFYSWHYKLLTEQYLLFVDKRLNYRCNPHHVFYCAYRLRLTSGFYFFFYTFTLERLYSGGLCSCLFFFFSSTEPPKTSASSTAHNTFGQDLNQSQIYNWSAGISEFIRVRIFKFLLQKFFALLRVWLYNGHCFKVRAQVCKILLDIWSVTIFVSSL